MSDTKTYAFQTFIFMMYSAGAILGILITYLLSLLFPKNDPLFGIVLCITGIILAVLLNFIFMWNVNIFDTHWAALLLLGLYITIYEPIALLLGFIICVSFQHSASAQETLLIGNFILFLMNVCVVVCGMCCMIAKSSYEDRRRQRFF